MADRYWVGGSGNWNSTNTTNWSASSGGSGGASVPTTSDNVFFDQAGPYTVTIVGGGGARACLDLTVSGANITFTPSSGPSINVAGSITLAASTTWSLGSPAGRVFLVSTTTGRTITTNGVNFGMPLTINSATGGWTLGSNLTINDSVGSSAFNFLAGTFSTSASNYSISTPNMTVNGGTLTLNASVVTVTGSPFTYGSGTLNVGTSTINLSGSAPTFNGGGQTYNIVSFTNTALDNFEAASASINGANTFATLSVVSRAAAGLGIISLGANQTITTSFTVQSGATDPARRVMFRSNTLGTARTITSASNTIFGADFRDITAAGAASWTDSTRTGYWGDAKGNTGITFAAGRTVYWNLGGTSQNWNATAWALTSTGTPNANNFPLPQDTAAFTDLGSVPSNQVNVVSYNLGTIDMSARTSAMTLFNPGLFRSIVGDWINGSGITLGGGGGSMPFTGRNTQTFTTLNKTFPSVSVEMNSPGGTLNLNDSLDNTGGFLTLTNGTFNTQNNTITVNGIQAAPGTRTINLGSSTINLAGTGTVCTIPSSGTTLDAGTSDIVLTDTSTTARTFSGNGLTYNKLTIGGATGTSTLTITGANTFAQLASTKTVAHSIQFASNQTITTWSVTGSSGNLVSLFSNSINAQRTLTITNRTSGIDYLDVRDITAPLAPVTFYAGANTRLRSNVQGVAAKASVTDEFIYVLASGTSFAVPANWNSANNEIHLFAGGGSGASSTTSSSPYTNKAGGGGGGSGGYTKVTNLTLTPSSSVSYAIGSGGASPSFSSNGNAGGNTTFNAGAYTTTGGGGGQISDVTPSSTGGTAGTGSTNNGAAGGAGGITTAGGLVSGGGGAGAGGPNGVGRVGGTGNNNSGGSYSGGGGGGNGGGSDGGNASGGTPGDGGNNSLGVGGGTSSSVNGFNGGGGRGSAGSAAGLGGSGADITNAGMGGGGGGSGAINFATSPAGRGGLFGGGGGGGGMGGDVLSCLGGPGGQGGIVIWYQAAAATATGNMFMMFG